MRHLALERRGQVSATGTNGPPGAQVLQVEIGLVEGARHPDQQPAPVIGRAPRRASAPSRAGLKTSAIRGGIVAQPVEVDGAVVLLLALGTVPGAG